MERRRAIVTGATSFIGIALIKLLIQNDYEVVAIIRPNSTRKMLIKSLYPNVDILEIELWDLADVVLPQDQYDVFFHIGWSSDFENSRFNLKGQLQNVDYCIYAVELASRYHCKKYLCVGSQAECGLVTSPINSLTPDNPLTAYAEAKCVAYEKTKQLCCDRGIQQYWPRLLSAYGPYDRNATLIMSCINACREKRDIELTGCEQIWDYVYIDDVAKALLAIIEKGKTETKYAIASGIGRPLREYVEIIAEIMNYPQLVNGIGKREYVENQVMYLVGDVQELCRDTGITIGYDFQCGIENILQAKNIVI